MSSTAGSGLRHPRLEDDVRATVTVVGGGISGLSTALLLQRAGMDVTLLEADLIGSGTTGHATGKLSAGQGLSYSRISTEHGEDAAAAYADSQLAALQLVFELAGEFSVECELERVSDHVYAETDDEMEQLEQELEASLRAGLPRVLERVADIPVGSVGAVLRLDDQGQLHARKYALGLAEVVSSADGCRIFENTRALGIETGDTHLVTTEQGT